MRRTPLRQAQPPAPSPAQGSDHGSVRTANLSLVLSLLRAAPQSRARLASTADLSKSATSSIVADLLDRGLVAEGTVRREGHVGRPGLAIHLRSDTVATLGVEINADHLTAVGLDLTGQTRLRRQLQLGEPLGTGLHPADHTLDHLARLVQDCLEELRGQGLRVPGIVVAAPGVIRGGTGVVHLSATLGWHDVPVIEHLQQALGPHAPQMRLDNDARLHAVAEYAPFAAEGVRDLVCLTGDVGVGCGIIADTTLLTGHTGFAGEVGHIPLGDPTVACRCGRTGCWENDIGLFAFLDRAVEADDPAHDPARPIVERLDDLARRAAAGDARICDAVDFVAERLTRGVSVLVDVLNPQVVVLGGYFSVFCDELVPAVQDGLDRLDIRGTPGRAVVTHSRLGLASAAVGGAVSALDALFADPAAIAPLPATAPRRSTHVASPVDPADAR